MIPFTFVFEILFPLEHFTLASISVIFVINHRWEKERGKNCRVESGCVALYLERKRLAVTDQLQAINGYDYNKPKAVR